MDVKAGELRLVLNFRNIVCNDFWVFFCRGGFSVPAFPRMGLNSLTVRSYVSPVMLNSS